MKATPSPQHTIWFEQQQAAFVYIPKVACTSWKLYLWQAMGHALPADFDYRQVHDSSSLPLPYVAALPTERQSAFQRELGQGSVALHAVIREPRARILSAYLDKILHHANPASHFSREVIPAIQQSFQLPQQQRPSFLQFLSWIESQPDRDQLNDHWRPMSSILGCSSASAYTQLCPMEQMQPAIERFAQLLGSQTPFPSRQQLGERRTFDSQSRLNDFYGEAEQRLFDRLYGSDVALYEAIRQA